MGRLSEIRHRKKRGVGSRESGEGIASAAPNVECEWERLPITAALSVPSTCIYRSLQNNTDFSSIECRMHPQCDGTVCMALSGPKLIYQHGGNVLDHRRVSHAHCVPALWGVQGKPFMNR